MLKYNPSDPTSFSQPDAVKVKSFHLDWTVSFEEKSIKGFVELTTIRTNEEATELILDTRDLIIQDVYEKDGDKLTHKLGDVHKCFGAPLTVTLPAEKKSEYVIVIEYQTGASCTALQWLTKEQTANGTEPYVFSQCQAIHCRSLVPIQDSPGVKCTYTADVKVPASVTALMSAVRTTEDTLEGVKLCRFEQTVAIPSYLVAIVVGDLVQIQVSPRVSIWCEQNVAKRAKYEFAETDKFVEAVESYCGPYKWRIYHLVVLPPSFPFGGMENPCLTFVTPTLLAGDRSAVDVIVHEITHSWTGNLVTCSNWEHFWLNEGFTVFIERKIEGALHGSAARHFSALEGWNSLLDTVNNGFKPGDPLTALVPKLSEVDPDDAFSTIPYEKGHTFLWYLEQLLAPPPSDKFDRFIRAYIKKFSNQSITTDDFKQYLFEYFNDQEDKLKSIDWNTWLNSPGLPPYTPKFDMELAKACSDLHKKWCAWDDSTPCPFTAADVESMSAKQIVEFLEQIYLAEETFPLTKLQKMADLYQMFERDNCEIRMRWLRICLKCRWSKAVIPAFDFLSSQGRMKFIKPIYRELFKWEGEVRQQTIDYFNNNKPKMMHVAVQAVASVMGQN